MSSIMDKVKKIVEVNNWGCFKDGVKAFVGFTTFGVLINSKLIDTIEKSHQRDMDNLKEANKQNMDSLKEANKQNMNSLKETNKQDREMIVDFNKQMFKAQADYHKMQFDSLRKDFEDYKLSRDTL